MRILFVSPDIRAIGGAENQCVLLASRLQKGGCDVVILSGIRDPIALPTHFPLDWRSSRLTSSSTLYKQGTEIRLFDSITLNTFNDVPVITCQLETPAGGRLFQVLLNSADLVHFHVMPPNFAGLLEMCRTEQKISVLKIVSSNLDGDVDYLMKHDRCVLDLLPQVDRLAAISATIQKELTTAGIPAEKICLMCNGVDEEFFSPKGHGGNRGFQVVYLGRLVPKKDVATLIEAWSLFIADSPGASLVIAGDGPLMADLVLQSSRLGTSDSIRFMGCVDDMHRKRSVLQSAQVFVYPTRGDATPNALLEAMACGLTPIVSDDSGLREVIDHGLNGLTFPFGDALALSNCLHRLCDNQELLATLGREARTSVSRQYSATSVAGSYLALYEQLTGLRAKRKTEEG